MCSRASLAQRVAAGLITGLAFAPAGADAQVSLAFASSPPPLVVGGAAAGQTPAAVQSGLTSWSLLGVWALRPSITAHLVAPLPTGVQVEANMSAPLGGTSRGWVRLTTTPQEVVTSLPLVALSGLSIVYRLTATPAAGVVPLTTRQVTYTVVWGS